MKGKHALPTGWAQPSNWRRPSIELQLRPLGPLASLRAPPIRYLLHDLCEGGLGEGLAHLVHDLPRELAVRRHVADLLRAVPHVPEDGHH